MGPAYSEEDEECNPWDAFATAMQLMRDKPDASEAEIAEAVSTCSIGGAAEPERMAPAEIQTAATQVGRSRHCNRSAAAAREAP